VSAIAAEAHLLVVDDDRLVLISLARGLRQAGYRVSTAADGEQALAAVAADAPALALLDVRMPGIDGIELGRRLHERGGIPCLYLSAYGDEDTVARAAAQGALGYLVKPLDVPRILPSIGAALARAVELRRLRAADADLTVQFEAHREIGIAVGLLMQRHGFTRHQAFELLRTRARAARRSVKSIAKDILTDSEKR
jgi:response regulator NasT